MENLAKQRINKNAIMWSILIMLPFTLSIAFLSALILLISAHEAVIQTFLGINLLGFFITLIATIMILIVEGIFINKYSDENRIAIVFGVETLLTFLILVGLLGTMTFIIPLIALALSIMIQLLRWYYLKRTDRFYC